MLNNKNNGEEMSTYNTEIKIPLINENGETIKVIEAVAIFDQDEPWFWGVEIDGKFFHKQNIKDWFRDEIVEAIPYDMKNDTITDKCLKEESMQYA